MPAWARKSRKDRKQAKNSAFPVERFSVQSPFESESEPQGSKIMCVCTIEGLADRELVRQAAAEVFGTESNWRAKIAPAGKRFCVAVRVMSPEGTTAARNIDLREMYPFGNVTPSLWIDLFSQMKSEISATGPNVAAPER
jgi:hypothetical protein